MRKEVQVYVWICIDVDMVVLGGRSTSGIGSTKVVVGGVVVVVVVAVVVAAAAVVVVVLLVVE